MPSLNWALKRTWLLDCIGSLIGSWALNQSLLYVYNRNNREVHCKSLFGNNYFIIVVIIKELLVVIIKKLNSWLKLLINVPRSLKMVVWYISRWLVFGLGTKTVNLAIVFLVLRTFLLESFWKMFVFWHNHPSIFLELHNQLLHKTLWWLSCLVWFSTYHHVLLFCCIFRHVNSYFALLWMSTLFFRSHSVALKQQRAKSPYTKCYDKKFDVVVFQYHFKVVNLYKEFFVISY